MDREKEIQSIVDGLTEAETATLTAYVELNGAASTASLTEEQKNDNFRKLPEKLRQVVTDVLVVLSQSDLDFNAAAVTPAEPYLIKSLLKYKPEILVDAYMDYNALSEEEKQEPETRALKAFYEEKLAQQAIHAAPFHYHFKYDDQENFKPVDWKSYSNDELLKIAENSDSAAVIYGLNQIKDRGNLVQIAQATAAEDPLSVFAMREYLKDFAFKNDILVPIIAERPFIFFNNYKDLSKDPGLVSAITAKIDPDKFKNPSMMPAYDFLQNYELYADQHFARPILREVAATHPDLIFSRKNLPDDAYIEALHIAARHDPISAYRMLYAEPSDTRPIKDSDKKLILAEAVDNMQPYLDQLTWGNGKELLLLGQLNALHESPDKIRFESIAKLNARGSYQLLTEGAAEAYTSTFNYLYKSFMQKMTDEKLSFMDFVQEKPERMLGLPAFINGISNYGKFSDFTAKIGEHEKDLLITEIINQIPLDPNFAIAAANMVKTLKPDDPALAVFESKLVEGYATTNDPAVKNMFGVLGSWYINSGYTPLQENAAALNSFGKDPKFQIPPYEKVESAKLFDESKRHFQMHVFYNDKDGQYNYQVFQANMRADGWVLQKDSESDFAHFEKTQGGRHVHIYATIPDPKTPEDDNKIAVSKIIQRVSDQAGTVSFVAHRGHSYFAADTIANLNEGAQIVFLGACGGTNFIDDTLDKSPSAHIIATSGTGVRVINEALLEGINKKILSGQDVRWNDLKAIVDVPQNENAQQYMLPSDNIALSFMNKERQMNAATEEEPQSQLQNDFTKAVDPTAAPTPLSAPIANLPTPLAPALAPVS